MKVQDLFARVDADFDVEEALATWRWLVPEPVTPLAFTATGDLFLLRMTDRSVLFLDTVSGTFVVVAESVNAWNSQLQNPDLVDQWLMPGFVAQLRDAAELSEGECYSPTIPPILGGKYEVQNWLPTHWRVHFHSLGQIHEQVKDLPEGTSIGKINFTSI